MYEEFKIYGPYKHGGRLRIIAVKDGIKHTISYPKYVMECHLGRYLDTNEQIDHIDGDPLNNDISNLQILTLGKHQVLDVLRNEDVSVTCTYCGKQFIIKGSKMHCRNRSDRKQSGYFCSRVCSGKYGADVQNGYRTPITIPKAKISKYKIKSAQKETFDVEAG